MLGKNTPESCPAFYVPVYERYEKLAGAMISRAGVQHHDAPMVAMVAELLNERDETIRLLTERLQAVEAALDADEDAATPARRGPGRPKKMEYAGT